MKKMEKDSIMLTKSSKFNFSVHSSVHGSFNYGNIAMLRVTAGRRCACSATFVIRWPYKKT